MPGPRQLVIVIGRGHGGTRAASWTLRASGIFMGNDNGCGDHVPPEPMYEAAKMAGLHVAIANGEWDLSRLLSEPVPPRYGQLVRQYAAPILGSPHERAGWKLPETLLSLPWLVKTFPGAYYIYWTRNLDDAISREHMTDDLMRWNVPCVRPKTVEEQRVESYRYQQLLMDRTPEPARLCRVRFEDFVLRQKLTLERMSEFLRYSLKAIPVDRSWVRPSITRAGTACRASELAAAPATPQGLSRRA
jgi:hypothetical protein